MIQIGDKLYILKRQIKKSRFTEMSDVKEYMEFIHAEHVLQNGELYLFVDLVNDVEINDEINK